MGLVVLFAGVGMLMKTIVEAQVGKLRLQMPKGLLVQFVIHTDHELMFEPAAGVEVAVELIDLLHCLLSAVDQAHQLHIGGEDVAVFLQLLADEVQGRSEEHTSELQSLMRISYAVFCLKKKKKNT